MCRASSLLPCARFRALGILQYLYVRRTCRRLTGLCRPCPNPQGFRAWARLFRAFLALDLNVKKQLPERAATSYKLQGKGFKNSFKLPRPAGAGLLLAVQGGFDCLSYVAVGGAQELFGL